MIWERGGDHPCLTTAIAELAVVALAATAIGKLLLRARGRRRR